MSWRNKNIQNRAMAGCKLARYATKDQRDTLILFGHREVAAKKGLTFKNAHDLILRLQEDGSDEGNS